MGAVSPLPWSLNGRCSSVADLSGLRQSASSLVIFLTGQPGGLIQDSRLETLHWLHEACRAETSRVWNQRTLNVKLSASILIEHRLLEKGERLRHSQLRLSIENIYIFYDVLILGYLSDSNVRKWDGRPLKGTHPMPPLSRPLVPGSRCAGERRHGGFEPWENDMMWAYPISAVHCDVIGFLICFDV